MSEGGDRWRAACQALRLLAVDPVGLKGLCVRARSGPARQAFVDLLPVLPLRLRKLHPTISDEQLFGGIDLSATLSGNKLVFNHGLMHSESALVLTMAERAGPDLAAKLAQVLDADKGHCLILLDEGAEDEEHAPPALIERLAFHVDLDGIGAGELAPAGHDQAAIEKARGMLRLVPAGTEEVTALVSLAARFGIDSLRAPLLALRAARANAALHLRDRISAEDLALAASLVYPSRATMLPAEEEPPPARARPPCPGGSASGR